MNSKKELPPNHRPLELVFVRHGESEGNIAVEAAEHGDPTYFTEQFKRRHSSSYDLTPLGVSQAKAAGKWIRENIDGGVFDAYYCSSYLRARKTAGYMGLPNAKWYVRDYIREHDWGILDAMTDEERREKYPDVMAKRDVNKYYFAAPGGESLADVAIRVRVGILNSLYRELPNGTGCVMCHGNIIYPVRILMEGLLPEQFQAMRDRHDPKDKINNCQILQYSRIDPENRKITEKFEWMRSVCPWDLTRSSNEWQRFEHKRYSNEELIGM